ncbi:MAG: DUF2845 domain-containing protein [Acidobacteriota bacterium]|nr:DUF2845 domain-containing protein [Acidobacteriota bacterium]
MKTFFLLIFTFVVTLTTFGQNKSREIDVRIQGIGSGTTYSTVIRKLGKPLHSKTTKFKASEACSGATETHLTLIYKGLEITLHGDSRGRNLSVYEIEVISSKWIASEISVGAKSKDVLTKFGEPNSKAEKAGEVIFYYGMKNNLGGVNFYFQNNRLIKILMNETLC